MGIVGRLDQYASMLAGEFDETTSNSPSITGLSTYYASEFSENIVDIVRDGLILNLDAGNLSSYSGIGTTWTDLSGNGNNGILTNGPTYNNSNGGYIVFDGTNDFINCGLGLPLSGSWTLFAFVRSSVSSTTQQILGRTGDISVSFAQNYVIYIQNNNKFRCGTSADSYKFAESTTTMVPNTWYCITGLYDNSTKILSIYVNGNFEGSSTALIGNPPTAGTQYVTLGAGDGLALANRLTGNIALGQIYNRALTAAEIKQNYNAIATRFHLKTTNSTSPLPANVFPPYDLVYDDFGGTLFGAGQGRYMRQNTDKSVIVYNEIDEVSDFYSRGVVRAGLVLDLDAGVPSSYAGIGTVWTDLSSSSKNGILQNGVGYTGSNGGVLTFDGNNDYAYILSPSPLSGTKLFSFEIWVNFTSITGDFGGINKVAWLFAGGTGTGSGQPEFGVLSANNSSFTPDTIFLGRGGGGATGSCGAAVSSLISNGTWNQIVLTRTSSNSQVIYLNATQIGIGNVSTSFSDGQTDFGAIHGNLAYDGYLNGRISNIKIYNRALTAAEVKQNYDALKGRFGL
jgi:hypothetical protein